jgi:hypothetical protein
MYIHLAVASSAVMTRRERRIEVVLDTFFAGGRRKTLELTGQWALSLALLLR